MNKQNIIEVTFKGPKGSGQDQYAKALYDSSVAVGDMVIHANTWSELAIKQYATKLKPLQKLIVIRVVEV